MGDSSYAVGEQRRAPTGAGPVPPRGGERGREGALSLSLALRPPAARDSAERPGYFGIPAGGSGGRGGTREATGAAPTAPREALVSHAPVPPQWLPGMFAPSMPLSSAPSFTVTAFNATGAGNALLTENADRLQVVSPVFSASATVAATGADSEVRAWSVGFIQTLYDPFLEETEYRHTRVRCVRPLPLRDGVSAKRVPWYYKCGNFTAAGAAIDTSMRDCPETNKPWDDPRVNDPNALLKLTKSRSFGTWLIARHWPSGRVVFLKHVEWGLSFMVLVDPAKPLGKRATNAGAGVKVANTGDGQGSLVPKLDAPIANDAATCTVSVV